MNTWKWCQLVCSCLLILLPPAVHYRNWKHADRRTKLHKGITVTLIVIWVLAAIGITGAMYQDLSQKPKAPNLRLYLNGFGLTNGMTITFPVTNLTHEFNLVVLNQGNWPADGVMASVQFPTPLSISPSGGWKKGRAVHHESPVEISMDSLFYMEATHVLPTETFLEFDKLYVQTSNCVPSMNSLRFTVAAKNHGTEQTIINIHYENGAGKTRFGF